MENKKPVKARLAEKWVNQQSLKVELANALAAVIHHEMKKGTMDVGAWVECLARHKMMDQLVTAYVAGFDKAKFLCVDFISRYVDRRPDMTEDEEAEWMKKMKAKTTPSQHMQRIGEVG